MSSRTWRDLAFAQNEMLAVRQLGNVGVTRSAMRNFLASERWVRRSEHVLSTTTGELTERQRMWLGVLHAGNGAVVGGLSAAKLYGLRNWNREDVTVLVPDDWSFEDVPGVHFFRTRRPLADLRATRVRGCGNSACVSGRACRSALRGLRAQRPDRPRRACRGGPAETERAG